MRFKLSERTCGANGKGGGGFRPGNTCAKGKKVAAPSKAKDPDDQPVGKDKHGRPLATRKEVKKRIKQGKSLFDKLYADAPKGPASFKATSSGEIEIKPANGSPEAAQAAQKLLKYFKDKGTNNVYIKESLNFYVRFNT